MRGNPEMETGSTLKPRPLSERILASLPGRRELWIVVWALVPWLNAGANLLLDTGERSAVWEQRTGLVILNYAALSVAIVVGSVFARIGVGADAYV